jgi:hypothetical protein
MDLKGIFCIQFPSPSPSLISAPGVEISLLLRYNTTPGDGFRLFAVSDDYIVCYSLPFR